MTLEAQIIMCRGLLDLDEVLIWCGCRYIEVVEVCEKHGFVFDVKNVRWTCDRYRTLLEKYLEK